MKLKTALAPIVALVSVAFVASDASAYYASHMGRWLSRDPLLYRDDFNLYAYAHERPVVGLDPFGTEWWQKPPTHYPAPSNPYGRPPNPGTGGAGSWAAPPPSYCGKSLYNPATQCCENCQIVDKVPIWICKGALGGDGAFLGGACMVLGSTPNGCGMSYGNAAYGPIGHSYIVCEDPFDNDRTDQFGFHPKPFDEGGGFTGAGYVNQELGRDPNYMGTTCRKKLVCPDQKQSMCQEGPWYGHRYTMDGCIGDNCHNWANK
jgi:hypothetical protein